MLFAGAVGEEALTHGCGFVLGKSAKGEETIYAAWLGGQDYQNKSGMYGAYPRGYLERAMMLFPDAERILHLFSGSLTKKQVTEAWQVANAGDLCRRCWHPRKMHVQLSSFRDSPCCRICWQYGGECPKGETEYHAFEPLEVPLQVRFDNGLHPSAAAAKPDAVGDAQKLLGDLTRAGALDGLPWGWRFDVVFADPPYEQRDVARYAKESGIKPQMPNKKLVVAQCAQVLRKGGWLVWLDTARPMYSSKEWVFRGGVTVVRSTNHRVRWACLLERR